MKTSEIQLLKNTITRRDNKIKKLEKELNSAIYDRNGFEYEVKELKNSKEEFRDCLIKFLDLSIDIETSGGIS